MIAQHFFLSLQVIHQPNHMLTIIPNQKQQLKKMKVAVVGVTGMVGQVMCRLLEERNFPITEFLPVASEKSIGKPIEFKGKQYKIYCRSI